MDLIGFIGEIKKKEDEEMKDIEESNEYGDEGEVINYYFMLKAE